MKLAVITGASSGMGREFAKAIAKEEALDEMWLIARRLDRLEALSEELKNDYPTITFRPISLDLSDIESIKLYEMLLKKASPDLTVLVNGSGFGKFGRFADVPMEDYANMIDLNSKSLVLLTQVSLPFMQKGAKIYNIDSLSSFQPVPYIAVYGATKSFVLSFSRAIGAELKPSGIRVLAICPGWVNTEFFSRAMKDDTITYFNRIFEPEDVVTRALKDMKRGKDVSILGFSIRLQVLATKLLPHKLVMKIWMNQQKKSKNQDKIKK